MKKEWNDRLNPIFIKELRQFFHSSQLIWVMFLMLVAMILSFIGGSNAVLVTALSSWLISVVFICCFQVSIRFFDERNDQELDYSNLSLLEPWRIVIGKSIGAVVMMIFLTMLIMPFLTMSILLGSIDILEISSMLLMMFCGALMMIEFSLLLATIRLRFLRNANLLILVVCCPILIVFTVDMVSSLSYGKGLYGMLGLALIFSLISGLFFVLSWSRVIYQFGNRMLPVRSYLIMVAILLIPVVLLSRSSILITDRLLALAVILSIIGTFICVIAACERRKIGVRIRNQIPRNQFLKWWFFLFSSGSGGGMALGLICFGLGWLTLILTGEVSDYINIPFLICGYFVFYAALTVNLRIGKFKNLGAVIFIVIFILLCMAPMILAYAIPPYNGDIIITTSPFAMDNPLSWSRNLSIGLPYLILGVLAGLIEVIAGVRDYWRRPQKETATTTENEVAQMKMSN